MSAIAEPRVRNQTAVPSADDEQWKYRLAVGALSEYNGGALADLSLTDALRVIAARACAILDIARCSVFVADAEGDQFLGCAAHPRDEIEPAVLRLKLGGPSDRLTQEIVAAGAPLLIRDAYSDPRALTGAIRAWKLRSLLGVPMLCSGQTVGLMMFDNGDYLHPYAPVDLEVALAFAALAATVLGRARHGEDLQARLDAVTRQNKLLRRTTVAEHRLSDCLLRGAGLGAVVELAARLTGKPAALYDAAGQLVAAHAPERASAQPAATLMEDALADARVAPLLRDAVPGASVMIEPVFTAGRHRHLAATVDVGGERWGWLVLMEHPARLVGFDEFLVRRAATYLTLELAGRQRQVASSADAMALLARQLIRGTSVEEELTRNAEYLGVRLDAHRVVVYLNSEPESLDTARLVDRLRARMSSDVLRAKGPEGSVLLVEVSECDAACVAVRTVKHALVEALAEAGAGDAGPADYSVGVSSVCRSAAQVPGGYREARQVARCIENVPGRSARRVLTADDLGPGRLFVANGNPDEIARFTEDVLGRLLQEGESSAELLRTLEAFYDTGRSVRLASERLSVHENTVRYRLSRVHSITGLDVASDADDQLSVQVALLVLRLQGHPGLRATETETGAATEEWR